MIGRRQMLGTTGMAGVVGAVAPAAATGEQPSDRAIDDVRRSIDELRRAIVQPRSFPEIAAVRDQLRAFLRSSGRFPDFIEVGVDVWFAIHDWYVQWQLPLTISRDASGRYTIPLMATTVVLRPDLMASFIGPPYDAK